MWLGLCREWDSCHSFSLILYASNRIRNVYTIVKQRRPYTTRRSDVFSCKTNGARVYMCVVQCKTTLDTSNNNNSSSSSSLLCSRSMQCSRRSTHRETKDNENIASYMWPVHLNVDSAFDCNSVHCVEVAKVFFSSFSSVRSIGINGRNTRFEWCFSAHRPNHVSIHKNLAKVARWRVRAVRVYQFSNFDENACSGRHNSVNWNIGTLCSIH